MWAVSLVLLLFFLPLYFPDGHLLSPRWRLASWLSLSYSAVALIYFAVLPGQVSDVASVSNPLGIEALRPVMGVMDVIMTVLFMVIVLCSVASLAARFRRSRGEQRQQMKWLTYAIGAMFAVLLIVMPLPDKWTWYWIVDSLTSLVFGAIPVAVGIAILRYRLYDIDLLINRTLVYVSLTATLVAAYFGGIVVLQRLFVALTGGRPPSRSWPLPWPSLRCSTPSDSASSHSWTVASTAGSTMLPRLLRPSTHDYAMRRSWKP
jgi:hypothetical protein